MSCDLPRRGPVALQRGGRDGPPERVGSGGAGRLTAATIRAPRPTAGAGRIDALPSSASRGPAAKLRHPTGRASARQLVTYVDEGYPPSLAEQFDPPPALFVVGARAAGDLAPLAQLPLVAVVGTRAPSRYGREMAGAIARGLAQAGVCVVSGLALGIDAPIHRRRWRRRLRCPPWPCSLRMTSSAAHQRPPLRRDRPPLPDGRVSWALDRPALSAAAHHRKA
jgi:hypothetical protein